MKTFCLTSCLLILSVLTTIDVANASTTSTSTPPRPTTGRPTQLSPQQIRQMPLLERPNRPGHFIGNTIRGMYGRNGRG